MSRISRFWRSPWLLYAALCSPLVLAGAAVLRQEIGYLADPAKYLLEFLGKAAVVLLVVTLCITPVRQLFPKWELSKALVFRRRQIGVSVFVYALLHFALYLPYVGGWQGFVEEWSKLFILSGLLALALLLVLAGTSNNFSVKRMGGKRWKRLHKLTYLVVALVIYHQFAQEKTGYRETLLYFWPLFLLEGIRLFRWAKAGVTRPA